MTPRSERGDTLVEILVSVVVLAIVVAGLFAGMTTTTISSTAARDQANVETALTSVAEAIKDPTTYQYTCPPDQYTVGKYPPLPAGWPTTSVIITTDAQWDGTQFQPIGTNPCNGQMQKLTITVQSPDRQVTWTRDVVKAAPR